ncbi:DUF669 domain-containing protein [Gammaproteobacteria bacterium]
MSNVWNNFEDAEQQQEFGTIPVDTLVKVSLKLRPGGYDDESMGISGGWATQSPTTGAIYLDCEYVVLEGTYVKRRVWSKIGLYSPKGPTWTQMGRSAIRAILNSARGFSPKDNRPQAVKARCIQGFGELNGLEFLIRVGIETDQRGDNRNSLAQVIEPNHAEYAKVMGSVPAAGSATSAPASSAPPPASPARPAAIKPGWA